MKKVVKFVVIILVVFVSILNTKAKSFSAEDINNLSEFAPGAYDIVYIFGKHAYFNRITIADIVAAANTLEGETDAILYYKDGANNWKNAITNETIDYSNLSFDLSKLTSENIDDLSDLKNSAEFVSEESNALNFALNRSKLKLNNIRTVDSSLVDDPVLRHNLDSLDIEVNDDIVNIKENSVLLDVNVGETVTTWSALLIDLNKQASNNIQVEVIDSSYIDNPVFYLSDINYDNASYYGATGNEFVLWLNGLTKGSLSFVEYDENNNIIGIAYFNYDYSSKKEVYSYEKDTYEEVVSTTDGLGVSCIELDENIYKYIFFTDMNYGDTPYYTIKISGKDYIIDTLNEIIIEPAYIINSDSKKDIIPTTESLKILSTNYDGYYNYLFYVEDELNQLTYLDGNMDYILVKNGEEWETILPLYKIISDYEVVVQSMTDNLNVINTFVSEDYGKLEYRYLLYSDIDLDNFIITIDSMKYMGLCQNGYCSIFEISNQVKSDVEKSFNLQNDDIKIIENHTSDGYEYNFIVLNSELNGYVYMDENELKIIAKNFDGSGWEEVDSLYVFDSPNQLEVESTTDYVYVDEFSVDNSYKYIFYMPLGVGDLVYSTVRISNVDYILDTFEGKLVMPFYALNSLEDKELVSTTDNLIIFKVKGEDNSYNYLFYSSEALSTFTYYSDGIDYIVKKNDQSEYDTYEAYYTIISKDVLSINPTSNNLLITEAKTVTEYDYTEYRYLLYSEEEINNFTYEIKFDGQTNKYVGIITDYGCNVYDSTYRITSEYPKNISVYTEDVEIVETVNDGMYAYDFIILNDDLKGYVYFDEEEIKIITRGSISGWSESEAVYIADADSPLNVVPTMENLYVAEVPFGDIYKYVFYQPQDIGDVLYYTVKFEDIHYIIDCEAKDMFEPLYIISSDIEREMIPKTENLYILKANNEDGTYSYLFYATGQLLEFEYSDDGTIYKAELIDDKWQITAE